MVRDSVFISTTKVLSDRGWFLHFCGCGITQADSMKVRFPKYGFLGKATFFVINCNSAFTVAFIIATAVWLKTVQLSRWILKFIEISSSLTIMDKLCFILRKFLSMERFNRFPQLCNYLIFVKKLEVPG